MMNARKEKRSFDKLRTSGEGAVIIRESVLVAIQTAARAAYPHEACGVLLGEDARIAEFVETRNVHPSPEAHFEIDPQALIGAHREARRGGPQVIGYFHSHPSGPAAPSATDASLAAGDGMIWAICGVGADAGDIGFWRSLPVGFETLSYAVLDE